MTTLPALPVWSGDPILEPGEPDKAYVWDTDEEEWVLTYPYLNKLGAEVQDSTPMEPPIGYRDTPDIWETVQRMVKTELLARELASQEYGSFEEEDDFEVGDDYEPSSEWENESDTSVAELMHAGRAVLEEQERQVKTEAEPKGGARPSSTTDPASPPDAKPEKGAKTE